MSTRLRSDSAQAISPGLNAFGALYAEDEEPWLSECYVEPADFDLIAGTNSVAVFGAPGSGKTALYRRLCEHLMSAECKPPRLVFEWTPMTSTGDIAAGAYWRAVLQALALAVVEQIAKQPAKYDAVQDWAKSTLRWLVHTRLGVQLKQVISVRSKTGGNDAEQSLLDLEQGSATNSYLDQAPPKELAAELVKPIKAIGLSGICVLVPPETFAGFDEPPAGFSNFLSTHDYFETPHFVFKFTFPAKFEQHLAAAGALGTRRIDVRYLRWQPDELTYMVEARLSLASGGKVSELAQVCTDASLDKWLMRVGGDLPRGWLEQVQPLVAYYLQRLKLRHPNPITSEEWREIRVKKPPRLVLDHKNNVVIVGYRTVELSESDMALLKYLHQNRGRICTRDELFHQAYRALYRLNAKSPSTKEKPKDYRDTLDTAISRLRKDIEPDPDDPLFIITKKGIGLELKNAW